ncbi:hypothetical protein HPB47_005684, partial [Ixodes persulcatus]
MHDAAPQHLDVPWLLLLPVLWVNVVCRTENAGYPDNYERTDTCDAALALGVLVRCPRRYLGEPRRTRKVAVPAARAPVSTLDASQGSEDSSIENLIVVHINQRFGHLLADMNKQGGGLTLAKRAVLTVWSPWSSNQRQSASSMEQSNGIVKETRLINETQQHTEKNDERPGYRPVKFSPVAHLTQSNKPQ